MFALAACAPIPARRYALDKLEFVGNRRLDDEDIEEKLASRETTRFLGVFSGIFYDYEVFDRYVLERDLERIERLYRARGYYRARARVARVFYAGRHTRVEIVIEEGPPVLVRRVDVHGLGGLSQTIHREALLAATEQLPLDEPFDEDRFEEARLGLKRALADHGYAYVVVKSSAEVDLPKNVVSVGFWLRPGRVARIGTIRILGLGDIPEAPVRRALDLKPGEPYSQSEIDAARQAVLDLGVFSSVVIEPDLPEGALDSEAAQANMPERVPLA